MRVLVAEAKGGVTVRSSVPFRVRDVFGKTYPLPAGEVPLGPKLRVAVNGTPTELAGPILFLPGTAPLELDRPYRGQIAVSVTGQKLDAVNVLGLEQYLQGVVAQEMPSAWPDEALKAQAVAARSYALAHRLSGKAFDLYADVRSQVYGGIAGENVRTTAAVQATKGQVLLWEGKPIDALFHSTSGGTTLDAAEVFGKPMPVPRRGRRPAQRALAGPPLGAGRGGGGDPAQGAEAGGAGDVAPADARAARDACRPCR